MQPEALATTLGLPLASAWLLKRLCGTAVDVAGEIFADRARLWRMKNLAAVLAEAGEYAGRSGVDIKQMALKAVFPLFDGASLEEEPVLRRLWAHLLANGSASGTSVSFLAIARELLRALSPNDAKVLQALHREVQREETQHESGLSYGHRWGNPTMIAATLRSGPFRMVPRERLLEATGLTREEFELCFDNISRFRVIEAPSLENLDGRELDRDHYAFTRLGWRVMTLITEQPTKPNNLEIQPQ